MTNNNEKEMNYDELRHYIMDDEWTLEEKYEMAVSGQYGAFELYATDGSIEGYRGFRKGFGTTEAYPTFQKAIEAAFDMFGDLDETD